MPKVRNAEYTKEYNRKVVLRLLRSHPASRAELARLTGLTRAATSLIANELLADGVIRELAPEIVGRGRSVIPLAICPDKYYAISVCLERDVCEVGLCDFSGDPVVCRKVPAHGDPLAEVIAQIERLLAEHDRSRVLGIGISSPGPLDSERGAILNPPRFPQWHGVEVAPKLSKWFSLPAYLENNAMALAMHQHRLGTSEDFLLMLVDQGGIGGGIVTRGKPLYGSRHFNCELGHASIRYDGRLCECGNRGCLEAYASIPNLLHGTSFPDWSSLIDAYGIDPEAKKLIQREAMYLATGIVNMVSLVNVDTIYLAGDIRYGFSILADYLDLELADRSLLQKNRFIQVLPADFRSDVKIVAAADIAFSRFLEV